MKNAEKIVVNILLKKKISFKYFTEMAFMETLVVYCILCVGRGSYNILQQW